MANTKIYYVVWLVYGYTAWIVSAYAWDWWKRFRLRKRQTAGGEHNCPAGDALNADQEQSTAAAIADKDIASVHHDR